MMRIAFFGHDASDSAVRRRVKAMKDDSLDVIGFMMRRREVVSTEWDNVDLGQTHDAALGQRLLRVVAGARLAAAEAKLGTADVIYARNLDMLVCAFLARRRAGLATPVVYECLDVHQLLTREDLVGKMFRRIEGDLLRRCVALVVSSDAYLRNHFEVHHQGRYVPYLVENRLVAGARNGSRPVASASVTSEGSGPLRLGWVGNIRCQRSMDLLCSLADTFPDDLEVRLHGVPARNEIPVFEPEIDARPNMTFFGRYQAPEDLSDIYEGLDIVWAGDFMQAGHNSLWLLPNRLYEGGYFNTPSIAPAETETAAWIRQRQCGFTPGEPLEKSLPDLIKTLISDRSAVAEKTARLADLPSETFVQPPGLLKDFFGSVLDGTSADPEERATP